MQSYVECVATACNLAANACLLIRLRANPHSTVPVHVVALQMTANGAWIAYASGISDVNLLITAVSSFSMQCMSLCTLVRQEVVVVPTEADPISP